MKQLTIIGRRWFQKSCGNTYHSAEIFVDGKQIEGISCKYGYGSSYLQSALAKLQAQGYLKDMDSSKSLWRYCEENVIIFVDSVTNVQRKKDL